MQTDDAILEAFENGNLINVLRGTEGYSVAVDHWVSANTPTDWTKILPKFDKYATKIGIDAAKTMLENAIVSLLNGNAEDLYIGISVFYLQILREEDDRSQIMIDRDKIISVATLRIPTMEKELRETRKWQGQNAPNGLWDEVVRYQKLLKSKFGINLTHKNGKKRPIVVFPTSFVATTKPLYIRPMSTPNVVFKKSDIEILARTMKEYEFANEEVYLVVQTESKKERQSVRMVPTVAGQKSLTKDAYAKLKISSKPASRMYKMISDSSDLREDDEHKKRSVRYSKKS